MKVSGPIVIVDDDEDDLKLFKEALASINVDESLIRVFDNCADVLNYLETTAENPFIILCDVNLPAMNGLEFRKKINENEFLKRKSIPFIFLSTTAQPMHVLEAYDLTVQGFFVKPINFEDIQRYFTLILEYWTDCVHPNSVKGERCE